jgi:glycosyltransferase involved in cell wall biosynthesis
MKVSIIVPVFNEERTLRDVVSKLLPLPFQKEIIIIDDCSTDKSFEIANELANKFKELKVNRLEANQGKGYAVKRGIEIASGEIVVVQDADLEYEPIDLVQMVEVIRMKGVDVVFGSRYLSANKVDGYMMHRLGNFFFTWFSNRLTGMYLTDVTTCYRVCRKAIFDAVILEERRFGIEVELVGKIGRLYREGKCRIEEIPIRYYPRKFSEGKKITWKDGFSIMKAIIRHSL